MKDLKITYFSSWGRLEVVKFIKPSVFGVICIPSKSNDRLFHSLLERFSSEYYSWTPREKSFVDLVRVGDSSWKNNLSLNNCNDFTSNKTFISYFTS